MAGDTSAPDRSLPPGDPARVLWVGFLAVRQRTLPVGQYFQLAAGEGLARAATELSVEVLRQALGHAEETTGGAALLLADAVARHAGALASLGRIDFARSLYEAARSLFEAHANAIVLAGFHEDEAAAWQRARHYPEAVASLDRTIAVCQRAVDGGATGWAKALAGSLADRGKLLQIQGDLPGAVRSYERALDGYRGCASGLDDAERASVLFNRGLALDDQGELEQGAASYRLAVEAFQDLIDRGHNELAGNLGHALINLGVALRGLKCPTEAVAAYDRSIEIHEELVRSGRADLATKLATLFMNRGNAQHDLERWPEAIASHDRAIAILEPLFAQGRSEVAGSLASALQNKGNALADSGQLSAALAALHLSFNLFGELVAGGRPDLAADQATVLMNLGVIFQDLGKLPEAVAAYDQSIGIRQRLIAEGRDTIAGDLARSLMNKGTALLLQGKAAEALHVFNAAIGTAEGEIGKGRRELTLTLGSAFANRGNSYYHLGKHREAVASFDDAVKVLDGWAKEVPSAQSARDQALFNKANALRDLGDLAGALEIYKRDLAPEQFRGGDLAKYHLCLAQTLARAGRRGEAVRHLAIRRQCSRMARRAGGIDDLILEYVEAQDQVVRESVRCALEAGDDEEAFANVREGKASFFGDALQRPGGSEAEPREVTQARAALTEWLAHPPSVRDEAGELAECSPKAWTAERDARANTYLGAWHFARHNVLGRVEGRDLADAAPPDLPAIQAALRPHWAVLDFWLLGETMHVFAVTPGGLTLHRTPFPHEPLRDTHLRLVRSIASPGGEVDQALGELYDHLFAPLIPWLRGRDVRGLYLVPDGGLHALPLHAARSPDGAHLCDEFDVAYLPSSALLPRLPAPRLDGPIFSMSNPEHGTPHSLPYADWEGEQIEGRFGGRGGSFLRGREATWGCSSRWGDAAVIHYSGHGVGDGRYAPLSHLRLADDLLLAHDVVHRRPPLREGAMVVLNGCQTAVRDARAYNEGMGLMTAFLLRGASFVLATQWAVEDRCAAEFVLAFLEQVLERGASPTQSLRAAQRKVRGLRSEEPAGARAERGLQALASSRPRAAEVSPLLWGAFQLVGRVV